MDDIGSFIVFPVAFAQVEGLHEAVRLGCAEMGLPVAQLRVAYSAHAHAQPTFGSPFVVVHLHAGSDDDTHDPFLFTVETAQSVDRPLMDYVLEAFEEDSSDPYQMPSPLQCWTVMREGATNYHAVLSEDGDVEDESPEPLENLASDFRLSSEAFVALLQTPATPWMPLGSPLTEQALAALRPLLPTT